MASLHRKDTLTYDPITGIHRVHQFDQSDNKHVISLHQEVGHILDRNKAKANEVAAVKPPDGSFRHVASIPLAIIELWLRQYGIWVYKADHWPRVRKLLNDPDWRYLRTDVSVL